MCRARNIYGSVWYYKRTCVIHGRSIAHCISNFERYNPGKRILSLQLILHFTLQFSISMSFKACLRNIFVELGHFHSDNLLRTLSSAFLNRTIYKGTMKNEGKMKRSTQTITILFTPTTRIFQQIPVLFNHILKPNKLKYYWTYSEWWLGYTVCSRHIRVSTNYFLLRITIIISGSQNVPLVKKILPESFQNVLWMNLKVILRVQRPPYKDTAFSFYTEAMNTGLAK